MSSSRKGLAGLAGAARGEILEGADPLRPAAIGGELARARAEVLRPGAALGIMPAVPSPDGATKKAALTKSAEEIMGESALLDCMLFLEMRKEAAMPGAVQGLLTKAKAGLSSAVSTVGGKARGLAQGVVAKAAPTYAPSMANSGLVSAAHAPRHNLPAVNLPAAPKVYHRMPGAARPGEQSANSIFGKVEVRAPQSIKTVAPSGYGDDRRMVAASRAADVRARKATLWQQKQHEVMNNPALGSKAHRQKLMDEVHTPNAMAPKNVSAPHISDPAPKPRSNEPAPNGKPAAPVPAVDPAADPQAPGIFRPRNLAIAGGIGLTGYGAGKLLAARRQQNEQDDRG